MGFVCVTINHGMGFQGVDGVGIAHGTTGSPIAVMVVSWHTRVLRDVNFEQVP
jgi:hypothetical protein